MKVKLKQKWFIRDIPYDSYGRVFVGRLYRKGVHDLPEEMYEQLPRKKDGTIVDWIEFVDGEPEQEEEKVQPNTLSEMAKKDYDEDPVRKKLEEAEETYKLRGKKEK